MFKKVLMIASMALALVAVAAPVASASWLHDHKPLEENAEVEFSGAANFAIPGVAGAEATIHVGVELEAGTTTATVTSFEATNCKGTGGLAGTTCTTVAEGLPWTAHIASNNTIEITTVRLHNRYWAGPHTGTPVATTILHGDIRATPDNAETISSVTLSNINALANNTPATVGGTLA
ncbi:MAG TPA: hypothetical protein VF030_10340, partial [Solirubrobacterales bacterium]